MQRHKPVTALQRRFQQARPASVLIFAVAVLVLLTIIGFAFLTSARSDRITSQQHSYNTEIELLVEGLANLGQAQVVNDLFQDGKFRDAEHYFTGYGPDRSPAPGLPQGDGWLASRLPQVPDPFAPASMAGNPPLWRFISEPLFGDGAFESPVAIAGMLAPRVWLSQVLDPTTHTWALAPTVIDGVPVLARVDPRTGLVNRSWPFIPAADADGDGIPDCGLCKVPMGPIDGVTYYVGVRIVDNSAAIDGSTAWMPSPSNSSLYSGFSGAPGWWVPGDFFPVNIDLLDLLNDPKEMNALNSYRWGGANLPAAFSTPIDDHGNPRPDFLFMSPFDAMWMQSGRRLLNPGYIAPGTRYGLLPASDQMALAHEFCQPPTGGTAMIERLLPRSLRAGQGPAGYGPTDTPAWFNRNFAFDPSGTNVGPSGMPIRSLLTVRNAVSNLCPCKFIILTGFPGAPAYNTFGYTQVSPTDFVICPLPFGTIAQYMDPAKSGTLRTVASTSWAWYEPPYSALGNDSDEWTYEPWDQPGTTPVWGKICANTGSFGQLMLAYWSVMSDEPVGLTTPVYWNDGQLVGFTADLGMPPFPVTDPLTLASDPELAGKSRMFRSPMRNGTDSSQMTPRQVMYLRAALAAINTVDMRDSDDDVSSRTIWMPTDSDPNFFGGKTQLGRWLTVYGYERQPFITEVYANNTSSPGGNNSSKNRGGFIAIELYNPYATPINLKNWQLIALDRSHNGLPTGLPASAGLGAYPVVGIGKDAIIPAGGYLVLASSDTPPPGMTWSPPTHLLVIPELTRGGQPIPGQFADDGGFFNRELVLERPRRADGLGTQNKFFPGRYPSNFLYDFIEAYPFDFAPVDQYDFTGLLPPATDVKHPKGWEWHYIRPNDASKGKAWHFVYPGPYVLSNSAAGLPRFQATAYGPPGTTLGPAGLASLGQPDAHAAVPYHDVPIYLGDSAGPAKLPGSGGPFQFPFGGFSRNADLLQVPFIGAYKLSDGTGEGGFAYWELNSITMDAALAEDDDPSDDFGPATTSDGNPIPIENIGRFCPISAYDFNSLNPNLSPVDDFAPPLVDAQGKQHPNPRWRYHWAMRLFDYLTVQAPSQDFLPDVDPALSDPVVFLYGEKVPPGTVAHPYKYWGLPPEPVANVNPLVPNWQGPNGTTEGLVPVHGLININTAAWRVLAAVPWVPRPPAGSTPSVYHKWLQSNCAVAEAIVQYRDGNPFARPRPVPPHGPFHSIFELHEVPLVRYGRSPGPNPKLLRDLPGSMASSVFGPADGKLVPYWAPGQPLPAGLSSDAASRVFAPVYGDYASRFLEIMRVSNLITTRSDSFTVYVVVQGWKDAGTSHPQLVVQRRAAYLVDRSGVTPINRSPSVMNVPTP